MMRKTFSPRLLASALAVPALAAEGTLKIVSVDVEGGGGTLFVTPEGKSLLIDTGWPSRLRAAAVARRRQEQRRPHRRRRRKSWA